MKAHRGSGLIINCLLAALALVVAGPVLAENMQIPEKFFRAMPQPDGSIQFFWTCPTSLDAKIVEQESGWWNACAKIAVLTERDPYKAAFFAASKDQALSSTGVTYADWSRSDQKHKQELREKLQNVVETVVDKYKLRDLLISAYAEPSQVALWRARQEKELAKGLGITEPTTTTLIKYCPGALGNVSINPQHPSFSAFEQLMTQSGAAAKYEAALAAFGLYLDNNPSASIEQRNAELSRLMSPLLSGLTKGVRHRYAKEAAK